MSQLRLVDSDLINNKSPRIPVCIVIDTSDEVVHNAANIRIIERGLDRLLADINGSLSLRMLTDMCIICFGNQPKITRPFGVLEENEIIELEIIGGRADLPAALRLLVYEYQVRLNDYKTNNIKRYTPIFFIISAYNGNKENSAEISQIIHWSRTGKAVVIPVAIGNAEDEFLRLLSVDGEVYQINSMNYERLFETFGRSIEMLSRSSASAMENLKIKSIEWDEFLRK